MVQMKRHVSLDHDLSLYSQSDSDLKITDLGIQGTRSFVLATGAGSTEEASVLSVGMCSGFTEEPSVQRSAWAKLRPRGQGPTLPSQPHQQQEIYICIFKGLNKSVSFISNHEETDQQSALAMS